MTDHSEIEVNVYSDILEEKHWHIEIEFVYVVEGICHVWMEDKSYELPQNEMLLINSRKKHFLKTEQGALVCKIQFSYQMICHFRNEDYIYLNCNSILEKGHKYTELREYVKALLMAYIKEEHRKFLLFGEQYRILDYLLENFQVDTGNQTGDQQYFQDQRISQILNYIYANYQNTVSLTEIAEKVYMTPSSLSRFFKKATGESFVQYIKKVRLQKTADELLNTRNPISRIAVSQGFSTPSAMNKDFREAFGITPTEYREMYRMESKEEKYGEERKKLSRIFQEKEEVKQKSGHRQYYRVNVKNQTECRWWRNHILNVGPAHILDTAAMRTFLPILKERLDFEYIRIWNLFSEQMMIYGKKKKETPNFSKIDGILDFCVSHGYKIFFDLGVRSNKAMASENKVLYSKEEGIRFHSQEEWERLLEQFLLHIAKRYGRKVVEEWIFEITFFLNEHPYYESDYYSTKTVWNRGYQIIKKNIPNARVAGPGLLVMPNESLMKELVTDFLLNENKPDIFTTMNMPFAGEMEFGGYRKITNEDFLAKGIHMVREFLTEQDYQGEYYVTDWSNSMANRNYIQDSCHKGTYILKNVVENYQLVDALGIWYATDLLNEYYDSVYILSGSAGIITKDGICKPSFYAFEFLDQMGEYQIEKRDCFLITGEKSGNIQILLFNNKELGAGYYMKEEDSYRPDELEYLFTNSDSITIEIALEHLERSGSYMIYQKILNPDTGSVLDNWVEMGCPGELRAEDITYLRNISVPKVSVRNVQAVRGKIQLSIQMKPHEMRWISLERI